MHHNAGCHPPPCGRSQSRRSILHTCCWRQKFSVHFSGIEPMLTCEPSETIGFRNMVEQAQICSVVFICIIREKSVVIKLGSKQTFIDEMRVKYFFIIEQWLTSHTREGASPHSHCTTLHCTAPTALIPLHRSTLHHSTLYRSTLHHSTLHHSHLPLHRSTLRHSHFTTAKLDKSAQEMNIEVHNKNAFDFDHILTTFANT